MQFNIEAWRAVSPYHQSLEDWQQWCEHPHLLTPKEGDNLSFLPVMKRRRLSQAARYFFAAAWPLVGEEDCPCVYASYDGEVNRSVGLWHELFQEGAMSPTAFALSVHNAILGQWSLMRGSMNECVAISAQSAGLESAVIEACGLLQEGAAKVLVVVLEDPIQTIPLSSLARAPFPFALAMLITPGTQYRLTYSASSSDSVSNIPYYESALAWIKHKIQLTPHWQQADATGIWKWELCHGLS